MKPTHATGNPGYDPQTPFIGNFRNLALLCLILISGVCGGCFRHFYSTNSTSHIDSATLTKLINAQKYFILHDQSHDKLYALKNVRASNESLSADLGPLLSEHALNEHPTRPDHNAFPQKDKDVVLYRSSSLFQKSPKRLFKNKYSVQRFQQDGCL